MARLSFQGVALLVLVIFVSNSIGAWTDCGSTLSQRLVRFNTLTVYPSPAVPGQEVHIVATYQAYTQLDDTATVDMNIYYQGSSSSTNNMVPVLQVANIPLCNFTSSVTCPVVATRNYTQTISFNWLVPNVADGDYVFNYRIILPARSSAYGCVSFDFSVEGGSSSEQEANYQSYYKAQLEGAAQYTQPAFSQQAVGDRIQVGPIGALGTSLPWGTFDSITGTGDVVPQSFYPTNYIWGLNGTLTSINVTTTGVPTHTYAGNFYVGYSGPYGSWNTLGNTLTWGTFILSVQQPSNGNSSYFGTLYFLPSTGSFATGWFNPINLGRLGPSTIQSNSNGKLVVFASKTTCMNNPALAVCGGSNIVTASPPHPDNNHVAIIVPVVIGGVIIIAIILFFLGRRYYRKHARQAEDRVYNPRPAEYGSALVVDDIMQKSRVHSGAALPILDHSNKAFPPAYLEDYPAPELPKPRTVRRTDRPRERRDRDRRRSTRDDRDDRDRRPAPRRPAYTSDSDFEPRLRDGRAASRSRSPSGRNSRSASPSDRSGRSRSRSRSISRSRSGSSRSMSRSRSPASGSSVSRSSVSEGPRR